MSGLSGLDAAFIGTVLEALFYGLYCVIFVLYIRVHTSKKSADRNILIYPLSILFILCTAYFAVDFAQKFLKIMRESAVWTLHSTIGVIYPVIDFIAQGVLIYRCWVVWNHRLFVVAIPFILALTSLATSLALVVQSLPLGETHINPRWFAPVAGLSFILSLAVNAILTGLLVLKIVKAARLRLAPDTQGRNELRSLVSILIESGVVLFVIQLVWVIFFSTNPNGFHFVAGSITMLQGIIPTLIVVRVGMRDAHNEQAPPVESNMRFVARCELPYEDSRENISMDFLAHSDSISGRL